MLTIEMHSHCLSQFYALSTAAYPDADILIAAIGNPGVIKTEWIKPGAVVIDVGFNHLADGKICGDIDFASAAHREVGSHQSQVVSDP